MGFLFASGKGKKVPEVTGLQFQTAVNTVAIPIGYGSPRVPINIIYANGFRSVKQKAGSSGGKGLLTSGKGAVTGYKYYATFIGAICEGELPSPGLAALFENQNVYTATTLPAGKSITFFTGSPTQLPWSVIQTNWPEDARSYKSTAYLGFNDYELDASGTIPQINVIITGKFSATCPLYTYTAPDDTTWLFDADPAQCVVDFLTNATYGCGFPADFIDATTLATSADGFDPLIGDAALSTYCQAVGFGWSVAINNSEPGNSILERWMKNLVVAVVWTGSKLKFIPYADTYYALNPSYDAAKADVALKYYKPSIQPLFALGDNDFLQAEGDDDPIVVTRIDPIEAKNTVRVNFRDRYNYFNDNVAESKDELEAERYGSRIESVGTADEFTLMDYASNSAQLQLQRNMSVRLTAKFRLGPQWCILEPMDIVTLTESTLGWDQFPVRIRSITEDEKGVLEFEVEEFRAGSMQPILYVRQDNAPPNPLTTVINAPSINDPIIFEPTHELLVYRGLPNPVVMIALSGGPNGNFDPNWGGADVYLSDDNITYAKFGTVTSPANMGFTVSTLPAYAGANPDITNTLLVDLTQSEGSLTSVTDYSASTGASVCALVEPDGTYELIGYTTAALSAPNQYTLSSIYRGMFGTQACEHPPGTKFVRLDDLVFETPLLSQYIGRQIYGKFPSFNIYGNGAQDLSQAEAYSYIPAGYGTGIAGNPLALAMQSSGSYPIDLGSFYTSSRFDLGSIGGECAPISFHVDLESV